VYVKIAKSVTTQCPHGRRGEIGIFMTESEATSSTSRPSRGAGFGLPRELLAKARDRLRVILAITLFAAVLSFSVRLSRALGAPDGFRSESFGLAYVTIGGLLSGLLLVVTRRASTSPDFALRLGLVYEVLLGYVLAIGSTAQEATRHGHAPYLTWATGLVVAFPLIVPSPPRTTLVSAIATGTSSWVAVASCSWLGLLEPTLSTYAEVSVSPIIGTVIAYFGSKVVYGLSLDYAAATRAGSYTLTSKLGVGGMGEVWRAEHQLLARPAAVKLIRRDAFEQHPGAAEEAVERFRREAQATALLRSPHTVQLYDYGVTDDGSFYYVMELLDGLDLESLVKKYGPVPPARAIHFLMGSAASLAEAHANGLIHRDVKPANVYVCQYGLVSDFIKVLDFGLVKTQPGGASGAEFQTLEEAVKGTPAFMSPEQIMGNAPVGPASDVYALGCVAYWLLTGRLPFDDKSVLAVMAQHVTLPPPPPSDASPSPVPAALEAIVKDCMAKDPKARPESMQVLHERLRLVAVEHPWNQEQAVEWWRAHAPEVLVRRNSEPVSE
jgi:serine/threonine-protein kinase